MAGMEWSRGGWSVCFVSETVLLDFEDPAGGTDAGSLVPARGFGL